MKILVIGDLHGQMPNIRFKDFDAIIAPVDFCLDRDIRKYLMISYREFLADSATSRDWWDICGRNKARMFVKKSLSYGRRILKKLDSYGIPVYVIPGNWDMASKDKDWEYLNRDWYKDFLIKGLKNVKDVHKKRLVIGEYNIIGYGIVNGPELLKYRDYKDIPKKRYQKNIRKYRKLFSKYDRLFNGAKRNRRPTIFLCHTMPFNTRLDKVMNKDSPRNGYHYGSNLAREITLKHRPLLFIGGHMHEHFGTCRLGQTVVLDAGFGRDKNTLIELSGGKIRSMRFFGKIQ